jgi:hypothetical protein
VAKVTASASAAVASAAATTAVAAVTTAMAPAVGTAVATGVVAMSSRPVARTVMIVPALAGNPRSGAAHPRARATIAAAPPGARHPKSKGQNCPDSDERYQYRERRVHHSLSRIEMSWAPSQRQRRPISRRRSAQPSSGSTLAKWLAAS